MKRVWFIIALVMIGGGACSTESGFDKDAKKILAGYSTPQKELAAAINAAKNDFPTATGLYQPDAWMLRQKGRDVEIWLVITGEDNIKHDTYYTLKKNPSTGKWEIIERRIGNLPGYAPQ